LRLAAKWPVIAANPVNEIDSAVRDHMFIRLLIIEGE